MRHWLTQRPGLRVAPALLPDALHQRVQVMEQTGCSVTLQKLESIAAHVVLASATHDGLHFTCVAACARVDLGDAAQGALDELETMVYTRIIGEEFAPLKPRDVASPADHTCLYAQKAYYRRADAVLSPAQDFPGGTVAPCSLALLAQKGLQVLYVNITPERAFIDQGRTAITVVKVIVPGLITLSFGYGREPRGMLAGVHRASYFPHPFP